MKPLERVTGSLADEGVFLSMLLLLFGLTVDTGVNETGDLCTHCWKENTEPETSESLVNRHVATGGVGNLDGGVPEDGG